MTPCKTSPVAGTGVHGRRQRMQVRMQALRDKCREHHSRGGEKDFENAKAVVGEGLS